MPTGPKATPVSDSRNVVDLPPTSGSPDTATDASRALRHAGRLGSSVLVTAAIGFVIQFLAADLLGKSDAGKVGGAESLSILLLGLMSFGVDTYARKVVAVRPEEARTFVPGVVALRFVVSATIFGLATVVLHQMGRGSTAIVLFGMYAASRFLLQTNELFAACLQATGSVKGLATNNLFTKLLWAAVILVGLALGLGPLSVPAGWIAGEGCKALLLGRRVTRELSVRWMPQAGPTRTVLLASLPFSAGTVVANWSTYFDVTLISFWFDDEEVGLYRIAQAVSAFIFLVGTVLPWVLMPLAARALERSVEDFREVMRRGMQIVLVIAIPGSVMLYLHADTILSIMGPEWEPAIPGLRNLAVNLLATYVILTTMTFLQVEGRAWQTVRIGLFGVVLNMTLNGLLLRRLAPEYGIGGAGRVAGGIAVVTEITVAALCLIALGRQAWDHTSVTNTLRVVAASVPVIVVDRILAGRGFSWVRLGADGVLYTALLLLTGALRAREFGVLFARGKVSK